MGEAETYGLLMILLAVLVGVGVGMTFGAWLGIAAGCAVYALTPIRYGK